MGAEALLIWLLIGAAAGYLASIIMKGKGIRITGNELVDDIILGIIGAFVGGWLLSLLGLSIGSGIIGSIINALIGACAFIFAVRMIQRA